EFARVWGRALNRADYVPLEPAERSAMVTALAGQLAAALSAEPFDADRMADAGYQVGAGLVARGYAAAEVLGCTTTLMYTRLADDLGLDGGAAVRVAALVEAVATGFVAAVRDRTLDAHDLVRLATVAAQARAERALRDSEARFRQFATHDALTGLPNRTLFTKRLTDRLAAAAAGS